MIYLWNVPKLSYFCPFYHLGTEKLCKKYSKNFKLLIFLALNPMITAISFWRKKCMVGDDFYALKLGLGKNIQILFYSGGKIRTKTPQVNQLTLKFGRIFYSFWVNKFILKLVARLLFSSLSKWCKLTFWVVLVNCKSEIEKKM